MAQAGRTYKNEAPVWFSPYRPISRPYKATLNSCMRSDCQARGQHEGRLWPAAPVCSLFMQKYEEG